jgi:D-glycero-D-manno-heptose 1,7-bisphosphate phosphatase
MRRPAAFLDRDGVLNEVVLRGELVSSPRSVEEYVPVTTARDDVARLRAAGFVVLVITNQPDLERGLVEPATLEHITTDLLDVLRVDAVMTCPHTAVANCDCRKPKPGLLLQAVDIYGVDLAQSWTVGDRWVDVAAGHAAGTRTVLLDRSYSWREAAPGAPLPDHHATSLAGAVDLILESERGPAR